MTVDQLREFLRAAPLIPFAIHLADDRALPVEYPEKPFLTRIAADSWFWCSHSGTTSIRRP